MFQQPSAMAQRSMAFGAIVQPSGAAGSRPLRGADLMPLLRRRKGWIIGTIAACLAAALILIALVPPRYTALTQILVEPTDLRLVENGVTQRNGPADASIAQVESQVQVLSSKNVLQRVVAQEKLAADPEFGGRGAGRLGGLGSLAEAMGIRGVPDAPADPAQVALEELQRRLFVRRSERTFVIDAAVASQDPAKAARIANAIAQAYLEEQRAARTEAARRATASLSGRLAELRDRVKGAEERANRFRAQNNLVAAGGRLVTEQQLNEVNAQLVLARSRAAEARARYEQLRRLPRGTDPGAIVEAVQSPTVAALRSQYAEIARSEADTLAKLGPRHPQVTEVRAQIRNLLRLIDEEVERIRQAARNDYERARANEASLSRSFEGLKRGASDTNQALVQLRELEREVEAGRGVYEAFLVRARETREQEGLDITNARIISEAQPPLTKSYPPRSSLLLAIALLGGLAGGLGLAVLRDATDRRIWSRQRLEAATGLRALALLSRSSRRATPTAWTEGIAETQPVLAALGSGGGAQARRAVLIVGEGDGREAATIGLKLAGAGAGGGETALLLDLASDGRTMPKPSGGLVRPALAELTEGRGRLAELVGRDESSNVAVLSLPDLADRGPGAAEGARLLSVLDRAQEFSLVVVALRDGRHPWIRSLAEWSSDIVVLVGAGRTTVSEVTATLDNLQAQAAKVRGTALVVSARDRGIV